MISNQSPGRVIVLSLELSLTSLKINRNSTKIDSWNFSIAFKTGNKK